MSERLESSSSIMLRKSGDKCCTTTNAIPGLGGRLAKNCSSDSSPPADAPIPTTRSFPGPSSAFGVVTAEFMSTHLAKKIPFVWGDQNKPERVRLFRGTFSIFGNLVSAAYEAFVSEPR